mgnify:CR=1 FL=1
MSGGSRGGRVTPTRCPWAEASELYRLYHDQEWGVPAHDEHRLFEMLVLEGAQAGLSWLTILNKREAYRRAYEGFDPARVPEDLDRAIIGNAVPRTNPEVVAILERGTPYLSQAEAVAHYVLARGQDSLVVLTTSMDSAQRESYGRLVCARAADLRIHHPHSRYRRYVTLSIGAIGGRPARDARLEQLLDKVESALEEARAVGDTATSHEI